MAATGFNWSRGPELTGPELTGPELTDIKLTDIKLTGRSPRTTMHLDVMVKEDVMMRRRQSI